MALGKRVLASNTAVNVFYRGFKACDSYANGDTAITQITCPVLFVLGAQDQMTQAKAAQPLIAAAKASGKAVSVTMVPVGHHQMTEAPDETLFAMRDFLGQPMQPLAMSDVRNRMLTQGADPAFLGAKLD